MKITKIEQQKKNPLLYSIFINGKYSFSLHNEVLYTVNIKEGQEVDAKELQVIIKAEQIKKVQNYALLLLSYRDRSYKEIYDGLKRKKFEEDIIQKVVEKLENSGYLNDYKYAVNWINQRLEKKPRGKRLISQELFAKGIRKEIIDETINKIFNSNSVEEVDLAVRALRKKLPGYKKLDKNIAMRRIRNFLLRRGFSYDVINKIVGNIFKNHDYID